MNVLVTGIGGFVGSHLTDLLLQRPDVKIFGIFREGENMDDPAQGTSVHRFVGDITKFDDVVHAVHAAAPEKVYHLAGQAFVPTSFENPNETFQTNFQGTLNVLEAVRRLRTLNGLRCSVLVVSSGEVYGTVAEERLPIDERFSLHPENPYAVSKACADMIAQQYRSSFNVDVVVARPFNHLGPRQRELFVGSAFAKQVAEIKRGIRDPKIFVGNLAPRRDFTDVRDVVRAYVSLVEGPQEHPVYNICSGRAVPIGEMLTTLCDLASIKPEIIVEASRVRANENPVIVGSARRLHEATGWTPSVPFRQTMEDLLHFWEARVSRAA